MSLKQLGKKVILAVSVATVSIMTVACVPVVTVPGPPNAVSNVPGNGQVVVSWGAPTSNGGEAVSGYSVTSSPVVAPPQSCTNSKGLSCTFSGLVNGTTYTFKVVAMNSKGAGSGSTTVATPNGRVTPTAPQTVAATSYEDGQSTITWTAPAVNGMSQIIGYTVSSSPPVSAPQSCIQTATLVCTYTGLTNNTQYTFTVQAINTQGTGDGATASATPTGFSFSVAGASPTSSRSTVNPATPGLYPDFSPTVTDYVSRCSSAAPIPVTIGVPMNESVSLGGTVYRGALLTTVPISRGVNQSFSFTFTNSQAQTTTYYVRCLPVDFPNWSVTKNGTPQAPFFLTSLIPNPLNPSNALGGNNTGRPMIFDNNGVPVWWGALSTGVVYSSLLSNGLLAIWNGALVGGSFIQESISGVPSAFPAPNPDVHDVSVLPNGDYLVVQNIVKTADLSAFGNSATASVVDPVVEEWTAQGSLVWSWDTMDHIPVNEMDPTFVAQFITPTSVNNDVYHWNSLDPTVDGSGHLTGFTASFRHLDAVFNIGCSSASDCSNGSINWKIGGTTTPQSLAILGDPNFPSNWSSATAGFGGQHDARFGKVYAGNILPSLTLYDNGTARNRASRSVRYLIDATAKTATMIESVSNSMNPTPSLCCGSSRKLDTGDWVVTYGGYSPSFSEVNPSNQAVYTLTFTDTASNMNTYFLYRALPLPNDQVTINQLRSGMDTIYGSG